MKTNLSAIAFGVGGFVLGTLIAWILLHAYGGTVTRVGNPDLPTIEIPRPPRIVASTSTTSTSDSSSNVVDLAILSVVSHAIAVGNGEPDLSITVPGGDAGRSRILADIPPTVLSGYSIDDFRDFTWTTRLTYRTPIDCIVWKYPIPAPDRRLELWGKPKQWLEGMREGDFLVSGTDTIPQVFEDSFLWIHAPRRALGREIEQSREHAIAVEG